MTEKKLKTLYETDTDKNKSGTLLKNSTESYKENVRGLRAELEKSLEKGVIMSDLEKKIKSIKKTEEEILEKLIPVHRNRNIENTQVEVTRLSEVGSYRLCGIVNKIENIGEDMYILSTSDNEIGIFRADIENKKIQWFYVEKIEISSISGIFTLDKGKIIIFGVSGEVFICNIDFHEEWANSSVEVENLCLKYDDYGFDNIRKSNGKINIKEEKCADYEYKIRNDEKKKEFLEKEEVEDKSKISSSKIKNDSEFIRRIGEKEIEIFGVDRESLKLYSKLRIKTSHRISDYISLDDGRILMGDKVGNLHILDERESVINILYENSSELRKIAGLRKTDSGETSYIWVYFSGGGYSYYRLENGKLNFVEENDCDGEVFNISSDCETAFILSDAGKNYTLEENLGKFYVNNKVVENFYGYAESIGNFRYIAFEVEGAVDLITIDRINTAEKLYNSNFIKNL